MADRLSKPDSKKVEKLIVKRCATNQKGAKTLKKALRYMKNRPDQQNDQD